MKIHTFSDLQSLFCNGKLVHPDKIKNWLKLELQSKFIKWLPVKLPTNKFNKFNKLLTESQISTEFTLRLTSGGYIQTEELIISAYLKVRKIYKTFFFAIKFKSLKINSTTIRTSRPQKHVIKNVSTA